MNAGRFAQNYKKIIQKIIQKYISKDDPNDVSASLFSYNFSIQFFEIRNATLCLQRILSPKGDQS